MYARTFLEEIKVTNRKKRKLRIARYFLILASSLLSIVRFRTRQNYFNKNKLVIFTSTLKIQHLYRRQSLK